MEEAKNVCQGTCEMDYGMEQGDEESQMKASGKCKNCGSDMSVEVSEGVEESKKDD